MFKVRDCFAVYQGDVCLLHYMQRLLRHSERSTLAEKKQLQSYTGRISAKLSHPRFSPSHPLEVKVSDLLDD